jgi:primosomal protein N' (replication factor Y)
VIQTFSPDHDAIRPVEAHDYERFYAGEIARRRELGYPPCGELVLGAVAALDADEAEAAGASLASAAALAAPGVEVKGPMAAPISKLRDRYRFQVWLRGRERASVRAGARAMAEAARALPARVHAYVDASPVQML